MALPELVVLDLDECVWSPEMYTLTSVPNQVGSAALFTMNVFVLC